MTLEPLLSASPIVQIHAYAAIAAFWVGGVVLFRKKGDQRHKRLGRIWVFLMAIVAISSFFIWQIRMFGLFSPIHILSVLSLLGLWQAIAAARARQIQKHRSMMQQIYIGALVVAGFFTFMPGRIMYQVVFDTDGAGPIEWASFLFVFFTIIGGGAILLRKRLDWRLPRIGRA